MDINQLTDENKVFIRTVFNEMRNNIKRFSEQRDFTMSNAQMFTFLSTVPASLAMASDGTIDEKEIYALEKVSKAIDVDTTINMNLMEFMSIAFEPENVMCNNEFNIRAGSELLFLSRNIKEYEDDFVNALKALLTFDFNPKADGSMTSAFSKLMDTFIENNVSKNKEAEMKKMQEFKQAIGIA